MEETKITVDKAIEMVMERLQRLDIKADYNTMRMLVGCLEQLQWARQEAAKMAEELAKLQAGPAEENPGGAD